MIKLFPLFILNETKKTLRDDKTNIKHHLASMITLDDYGINLVDKFLEKYNTSCLMQLMELNRSIQLLDFRPWLMVFFEDEYRIAGHLSTIIENKDDLLFTAYSIQSNYSIQESGVPPVSILLVKNKSILKSLSNKSELFYPVWEHCEKADEKMQWVFISRPPSKSWYNKIIVGDDKLYLNSIKIKI